MHFAPAVIHRASRFVTARTEVRHSRPISSSQKNRARHGCACANARGMCPVVMVRTRTSARLKLQQGVSQQEELLLQSARAAGRKKPPLKTGVFSYYARQPPVSLPHCALHLPHCAFRIPYSRSTLSRSTAALCLLQQLLKSGDFSYYSVHQMWAVHGPPIIRAVL